jgi:hypothetical protein
MGNLKYEYSRQYRKIITELDLPGTQAADEHILDDALAAMTN